MHILLDGYAILHYLPGVMKFTCPHCGESFEVKIRKASTSKKANAARKRNAVRGGPAPAVSVKVLARIYRRGTEWGPTKFMEEIEKVTGHAYSLAQSCRLLELIRDYENCLPREIWTNDKVRDAWFDERVAQGNRTHAMLSKDMDGVSSNSAITVFSAMAIDSIKEKLKAHLLKPKEADNAIAEFERYIKAAREWVNAYNDQNTMFRQQFDSIGEKLDAGKISKEEAEQSRTKIRRENVAARKRLAADARKTKEEVLRVATSLLNKK